MTKTAEECLEFLNSFTNYRNPLDDASNIFSNHELSAEGCNSKEEAFIEGRKCEKSLTTLKIQMFLGEAK